MATADPLLKLSSNPISLRLVVTKEIVDTCVTLRYEKVYLPLWKGVSATLKSGRYTLSYLRDDVSPSGVCRRHAGFKRVLSATLWSGRYHPLLPMIVISNIRLFNFRDLSIFTIMTERYPFSCGMQLPPVDHRRKHTAHFTHCPSDSRTQGQGGPALGWHWGSASYLYGGDGYLKHSVTLRHFVTVSISLIAVVSWYFLNSLTGVIIFMAQLTSRNLFSLQIQKSFCSTWPLLFFLGILAIFISLKSLFRIFDTKSNKYIKKQFMSDTFSFS